MATNVGTLMDQLGNGNSRMNLVSTFLGKKKKKKNTLKNNNDKEICKR
uniref:Uncharacterized protein n=1 Tax=Daphnia galeata TaxID=27404 RepID=A0A8J2RNL6_9CRUS|nr:unnamed protein product [Daphnia galeata]